MKIKKVLSVMLCLVLGCCMFAACSSTPSKDDEVEPPKPQDGSTLSIFINNQGYGMDWLSKLGEKFGELFNVKVMVVGNPANDVGTNAIGEEKSTFDLVFSGKSLPQYIYAQKLADISDVYSAIPDGETKTIEEKLDTNKLAKAYKTGDKYFMMPWTRMLAGIHYNIDVLDNVFGKGKWKEPATSKEFITMLDDIKTLQAAAPAATRAYGIVLSREINYWAYIVQNWAGQYEGFDDFSNYSYGEYVENGVRKVATNAETYEKALNVNGRLRALQEVEKFLPSYKGYINPVSEGIGYVDHQKQLASGEYKSNKNPSAFLVCGDWYEKETRATVKANGEPVRFMKTPVLSSIVETLEDKTMTDEKLSEIISAIDNGKKSYSGVSKKDFDKIVEARKSVTCGVLDHAVAIPKKAKNISTAKSFLIFMASDLGQSIYSANNDGMVQPYGYDSSKNESVVISKYVSSLNNSYKDGFLPIMSDVRSPLVTLGSLDFYGGQGLIEPQFYNLKEGSKFAETFHNSAIRYEKNRYLQIKDYIAPSPRVI